MTTREPVNEDHDHQQPEEPIASSGELDHHFPKS